MKRSSRVAFVLLVLAGGFVLLRSLRETSAENRGQAAQADKSRRPAAPALAGMAFNARPGLTKTKLLAEFPVDLVICRNETEPQEIPSRAALIPLPNNFPL